MGGGTARHESGMELGDPSWLLAEVENTDWNPCEDVRFMVKRQLETGDRVIIRACEDVIGTWRPGVVARFDKYPPRLEDKATDRYSYPVWYKSDFDGIVMGWYDPMLWEVLCDMLLNRVKKSGGSSSSR